VLISRWKKEFAIERALQIPPGGVVGHSQTAKLAKK